MKAKKLNFKEVLGITTTYTNTELK